MSCVLVVAAALALTSIPFKSGNAKADTIQIVALGTSNTRGKGVPAQSAYPAQLQHALRARGHDVHVLNAGVDGDTTRGLLRRVGPDVPPDTQIVLVEPGYNDARRGVSKAQVRRNLDAILQRLRARGIEVLLFGVPKNNVSALARSHGAVYRAPIRYGFTRGVGKTRREYAAADGFHLNARAYALVVSRILSQVERLIERVRDR